MDGLDVLVFTGGVGEHAPAIRAAAAEQLGMLGVEIDAATNATVLGDAIVSPVSAAVATVVVSAREDLEIARQARAALADAAEAAA
jgi:acetate kinase